MMGSSWEKWMEDAGFRNWLTGLLNEMKCEIIDQLKKTIKENGQPALKKWVKSAEVKKLLGVSHGKLQSMRSSGIISYTKIGGTLYYNIDDIHEMLNNNRRA